MLKDELGLYWAITIAILMKMVRKSNSLMIFLNLIQLYNLAKLRQWKSKYIYNWIS